MVYYLRLQPTQVHSAHLIERLARAITLKSFSLTLVAMHCYCRCNQLADTIIPRACLQAEACPQRYRVAPWWHHPQLQPYARGEIFIAPFRFPLTVVEDVKRTWNHLRSAIPLLFCRAEGRRRAAFGMWPTRLAFRVWIPLMYRGSA